MLLKEPFVARVGRAWGQLANQVIKRDELFSWQSPVGISKLPMLTDQITQCIPEHRAVRLCNVVSLDNLRKRLYGAKAIVRRKVRIVREECAPSLSIVSGGRHASVHYCGDKSEPFDGGDRHLRRLPIPVVRFSSGRMNPAEFRQHAEQQLPGHCLVTLPDGIDDLQPSLWTDRVLRMPGTEDRHETGDWPITEAPAWIQLLEPRQSIHGGAEMLGRPGDTFQCPK